MPSEELIQRLIRLPYRESGVPVEWADISGNFVSIRTVTAFSWCFSLEAVFRIPADRLPEKPDDLVWLLDSLHDLAELRIAGQGGYYLSSLEADANDHGVFLGGCSGQPIREQRVVVRQEAAVRYWCWPLPPDGSVVASITWPAVGIDDVVGSFEGEGLRRAARRSTSLDADMRPQPGTN